jgi:hypothetical protein
MRRYSTAGKGFSWEEHCIAIAQQSCAIARFAGYRAANADGNAIANVSGRETIANHIHELRSWMCFAFGNPRMV